MNATIFLGPSMSAGEARAILPGAVFRPPAAQGDLLAAADRDRADIIGLIDGTFHQNLSVWHNEVCFLLSRGLTVCGASSMGALRAVETETYGTVGAGEIYRWYRDGIVSGDDEVALLHGDEHGGYPSLSLPMVNIRASIHRAVSAGRIRAEPAARAVEAAKSIHYQERVLPNILGQSKSFGLSDEECCAVQSALTVDYVDQKKEDARELLELVAGYLDGSVPRPQQVAFDFARSSTFETLYYLDRDVHVNDYAISQERIAEHTALYCPEFRRLRRSSLDRTLVAFFAALLDIRVTQEEVAKERASFCEERSLDSEKDLARWLAENAFSERDFMELLTQEACCRRLRLWALNSRSFDRGCKALLDELRLVGLFPRWAAEAADGDALFAAYRDQPEYLELVREHPGLLSERHAAFGHVHIKGDARVWAEEAGFDGATGLAEALQRSAVINDVRDRITKQVKALEDMLAVLPESLCEAVNGGEERG